MAKVTPRNASIHDEFVGEGYFTLRLAIGELEDLESLLDLGPAVLLARLQTGQWRVKDLRETIRLGLIGGGDVSREQALKITERTVKEGNLLPCILTCGRLVQAAIMGVEDDPVGEPQAATARPSETTSPTGESDGPMSTTSAEPQVTRRRKSAR